MKDKIHSPENPLPGVLVITSYPPRECGIATYSQDLVKALNHQFGKSFSIQICALESVNEKHDYAEAVKYILNVDRPDEFEMLASKINRDPGIQLVLIQHEFGFFDHVKEAFVDFMRGLSKPVIIVFHTILPRPDEPWKKNVQEISGLAASIVVMTHASADILKKDYAIDQEKISVIPHGVHLVRHLDAHWLKNKYQLAGKKVLSTFGLMSPGKSIETTLEALPGVVKRYPEVLFLIIGKTHPTILKQEGEAYRERLKAKVVELHLQANVRFVNHFLPLDELLEYLQLTDIYLFTSKDPNQAVSGTFSYAISCGCPIISTPIPHSREVLKGDAGIIFDFENSVQLTKAINDLLNNDALRRAIGSNGLHRMASCAWENAAISHTRLFQFLLGHQDLLQYTNPEINLEYVKKLTTNFGMIQFSKINHPDLDSGYTLDDNARALIAMCKHFELTKEKMDLVYIKIYLHFIKYCQQEGGHFLNYVDEEREFTEQNGTTNLEDSNGRAIWGLGYLLSLSNLLPSELVVLAESMFESALLNVEGIHSARAMGFVIKGLYYYSFKLKSESVLRLARQLANRLVQMYRHEKTEDWQWFESYLTYANSILPEAILFAWLLTGDLVYREIAKESFDFLLSKVFSEDHIRVISNKNWLYKGHPTVCTANGGEQPIDVAYTILALKQFYFAFKDSEYRRKMETAFSWFLGNNHLHQIIYNPCTGGCYDGLEEDNVNLNQGAESTISYLLARLEIDFQRSEHLGFRDKTIRDREVILTEGLA